MQKYNTSTKKLQLAAVENCKTTTLTKYRAPNPLCLNNEQKNKFVTL